MVTVNAENKVNVLCGPLQRSIKDTFGNAQDVIFQHDRVFRHRANVVSV